MSVDQEKFKNIYDPPQNSSGLYHSSQNSYSVYENLGVVLVFHFSLFDFYELTNMRLNSI